MTTNPAIDGLSREDVMALLSGRVQQQLFLIGADEIRQWAEGVLSQLVQEGWLRRGDNAKEVTCDGCHDRHVEEVQYVEFMPDHSRAYVVCPVNGFAWVDEERLIQWEINSLRFVAQMNAAKNAKPKPTPAPTINRDPAAVTLAKYWSRDDGTFCFATWTNGNADGVVEFALDRDRMTNQARLIQVLCAKWPNAISALELLRQVYQENGKLPIRKAEQVDQHFKKFVTLISDVRIKKFKAAGLNPDIIPPLTEARLLFEHVRLRVRDLQWTDDPGWAIKNVQGRRGWENEVSSIDIDLQNLQQSEEH